MNESIDYANRTVEVSLVDLFWSLLRKWRAILACLLILGIGLGGYGFMKEYKTYSNATTRAARQTKYESSLHDYEVKKEALEAKIDNLEMRIEFLNHARENSLMLKIDPNNVFRIVTVYYVDSDYEIIPESVYQNPDYTNSLLKGYRNAVQRIEYNDLVKMEGEDELFSDPPITTQTVKRIYSAGIDETANLLTVIIISEKEERADQIMSGVKAALDETNKTLTQAMGKHTLSVVSESREWVVDTDLYKSQAEFQEEYSKVAEGLDAARKELSSLSKPKSTVLTKKDVIKAGIKFGVIGLALGLILPLLYYGIKLILQDKVKSVGELGARYNMPVLGTAKVSEKKQGKLDAKIASALGMSSSNIEDSIKYVAANIGLRAKNKDKVLLLGNTDRGNLEKIAEMIQPEIGDKTICVGGDLKSDYSAIFALNDDCAVVLVEDLQKTKHSDIVNEIKTVQAAHSDKIGFIVLQ